TSPVRSPFRREDGSPDLARADHRHPPYPASAACKGARSAIERGLTERASSSPPRSSTTVGHSFTDNERPKALPRPSSTLMCATSPCIASNACNGGCAATQCGHHG